MDKELEQKLVEKYPNIFKDYGGDIRETCMGWGMSCGDGWYDLLDRLCEELSKYEGVVAAQVKEKFGGLRFYINGTPPELFDEIHGIIHKYEAESFKTCETCGEPGERERRGGGWIRTTCDKCQAKFDEGKVPWKDGWDD